MRALIVDDNRNYLDALASEIRRLESRITSAGRVSTIRYENDSPYDIALKICREIPANGEALVMISHELSCKDLRLQDSAGEDAWKSLSPANDSYVEKKKSLY